MGGLGCSWSLTKIGRKIGRKSFQDTPIAFGSPISLRSGYEKASDSLNKMTLLLADWRYSFSTQSMFRTSARLKIFLVSFPRTRFDWDCRGLFCFHWIATRGSREKPTTSTRISYAQTVGTYTTPDTCYSTRDSATCECMELGQYNSALISSITSLILSIASCLLYNQSGRAWKYNFLASWISFEKSLSPSCLSHICAFTVYP